MTCSIQALQLYLAAAAISSGPISPTIDQKGRVSQFSL